MDNVRNSLFGKLILATGLVTEKQLAECLEEQKRLKAAGKRVPRLGELMAKNKLLTVEQVKKLLRKQRDTPERLSAAEVNSSVKPEKSSVEQSFFGNYEILHRLGQDANGVTFKARHKKNETVVSLRALLRKAMDNSEYTRLFTEQIRKAAALNHVNILRIISAGSIQNRLYYTSEFVEGTSLRCLLENRGYLDIATALDIALQTVQALECGHGQGVFHQELTPSHIIILADETVKITGFGAVADPINNLHKLAQSVGDAPFYVAPEQATGEGQGVADARTDIYSLGAILYHSLAGKPPFHGKNVQEVLLNIAEEDLVPLKNLVKGMPDSLSNLVQHMLAVDPGERPANAAVLRKKIASLAGLSVAGVVSNNRETIRDKPRFTSSRIKRTRAASDHKQKAKSHPGRAWQHAGSSGPNLALWGALGLLGMVFIIAFGYYLISNHNKMKKLEREKAAQEAEMRAEEESRSIKEVIKKLAQKTVKITGRKAKVKQKRSSGKIKSRAKVKSAGKKKEIDAHEGAIYDVDTGKYIKVVATGTKQKQAISSEDMPPQGIDPEVEKRRKAIRDVLGE